MSHSWGQWCEGRSKIQASAFFFFFGLGAKFSVTQLKAFKTFFSPKFGVAVVVKNRQEVLQRVWENQHFRDTQEDLDSIVGRGNGYCVGTWI